MAEQECSDSPFPQLAQPQPIYPRLSETFYERRPSVDRLFDAFLFDDGLQPLVLESSDSEMEFDLALATTDPLPITAPQILAALSQAAKPEPASWYSPSYSDPSVLLLGHTPSIHSGTIVNGQFIPNTPQDGQHEMVSDMDSDSSLVHHALETFL